MQWVVTTGRTVEQARERALDALGIDASDLEYEVLDEPGSSLFGLRRTDARVRARVRPTAPRPKVDRKNRRKGATSGKRRRRSKGASQSSQSGQSGQSRPKGASRKDTAAPANASGDPGEKRPKAEGRDRSGTKAAQTKAPNAPEPSKPSKPAEPPESKESAATDQRRPPHDSDQTPSGATGDSMSDITLDEQEPSAVAFVRGLVDAFGVDAEVATETEDDEHLEIAVTGEDLGLLVGPRGATLNAIQELTRTAVAQQHSGRLQGRMRVDVAGYRARRKEALERFVTQQAERVQETGTPVALEPMSPPDRKIVHDAINAIDGVHTTSEGEDRRRHVVILPD